MVSGFALAEVQDPTSANPLNQRTNKKLSMSISTLHVQVHDAQTQTCSRDMDMQYGHASSMDMGMQHGHGHAAHTWACSMGIKQACSTDREQAVWTGTRSLDMDMDKMCTQTFIGPTWTTENLFFEGFVEKLRKLTKISGSACFTQWKLAMLADVLAKLSGRACKTQRNVLLEVLEKVSGLAISGLAKVKNKQISGQRTNHKKVFGLAISGLRKNLPVPTSAIQSCSYRWLSVIQALQSQTERMWLCNIKPGSWRAAQPLAASGKRTIHQATEQ